ncbi:MAG: Cys-tRNA(Pro) deacylase [Mogibacterium sp.]|nr:Cys-tRNA(Pro) deacylase [Mogibacterium sp.]
MVMTPAVEALEAAGAKYRFLEVPGSVSGEDYCKAVNELVGKDVSDRVYKTLVMQGNSGTVYVFAIPALSKLAQRQVARALGEKELQMLKPIDLKKLTGYVHGGCSPLGMKHQYRTILDEVAGEQETIMINGGGGGYLVELSLEEFGKALPYELMPLKK